ncbi:NAD-dependent epimerase/dehydratase family protein [Streptomyces sp. FXJ1.4098]|nr:NAD-dependent epimerase/dehydratase family protein [Streptomyces sp. FXJ1.4098]
MTTRTAPDRGPGRTGGSVVVLGGTGFLGRHVCAAFAAAGADVVPFSRTARPPAPPWTTAAQPARTRSPPTPAHWPGCARTPTSW